MSREISLHSGEEVEQAFQVPRAQTGGYMFVHFKSGDVIRMANGCLTGGHPRVDTRSHGTADGLVARADRVQAVAGDAAKIISGHGSLPGKAELNAGLQRTTS